MEKTEQAPLLLAIETATEVASVAVFSGEKLLGEIRIHQEKVHARLLLPMIQSLLRDLTIDRHALSAIGISSGPGSYTGLRVGVSAAKGLCLALGKPLIAVPTLE
ncbi:MAG: tRNA (adenosine(37)-N6)-threonylcarbamoyltransferase complex dimerization subunit type 1 TsaB, partial [Bacteroidetes bacterium]